MYVNAIKDAENFEQIQQNALSQFQQILNTNDKSYSPAETEPTVKKRKRFTKRRGQGRNGEVS